MDINKLLNLNRNLNDWEDKFQKERDERKAKLKEVNRFLNIDNVKTMEYDRIKNIYDIVKYNLDSNKLTELENVLEESKKITYPILKKAHYYPVINEIEFLNDQERNQIDLNLFKCFRGQIDIGRLCHEANITIDSANKVVEFLYDKGVLSKDYAFVCSCGEEADIITEELYNLFKEYYKLEELIREGFIEENSHEKYMNLFNEIDRHFGFEIGCYNCNGLEITSMSVLEDHSSIIYVK